MECGDSFKNFYILERSLNVFHELRYSVRVKGPIKMIHEKKMIRL